MLNKYYYSDILFYSQGILMFYITTLALRAPILKERELEPFVTTTNY